MAIAALKRKGLKQNKQSGFTLVELIVVVGLISMIAIYITIEINQSSDDAKVGIATAFLVSNVPSAISSYRARHMGTCAGISSEALNPNEVLDSVVLDSGDVDQTNLKKRLVKRGLSSQTPWGQYWTTSYDATTLVLTITYPVPGADALNMSNDIKENIESQGKVAKITVNNNTLSVEYNCA